jgi:hypothetical protein
VGNSQVATHITISSSENHRGFYGTLNWEKSNDLWATVLLEPSSKSSTLTDEYLLNGIPTQIKDLILEYDDIFQTPSALPPSRVYDHASPCISIQHL